MKLDIGLIPRASLDSDERFLWIETKGRHAMSKRELIDTGTDKRKVLRDEDARRVSMFRPTHAMTPRMVLHQVKARRAIANADVCR